MIPMPSPDSMVNAQRWHIQRCTRCNRTIEQGGDAYSLYASRYEPMPDGPDWECVGDWTDPNQLAVPGVLCSGCFKALERFTMGFEFFPPGGGLDARIAAREVSRG